MESNKTFFIIKPEVFNDGKAGEILEFIGNHDFKISHLRLFKPERYIIEKHYEHLKWEEFFPDLVQYMTSGQIMTGILEKDNAISEWRKLMGATDPTKAEKSTVRKTFGYIKNGQIFNSVHGSDSLESFKKEVELWYPHLGGKEDE